MKKLTNKEKEKNITFADFKQKEKEMYKGNKKAREKIFFKMTRSKKEKKSKSEIWKTKKKSYAWRELKIKKLVQKKGQRGDTVAHFSKTEKKIRIFLVMSVFSGLKSSSQ